MKVALVWPPFDTMYTMPLPLGYLKANLPAGEHEVRIFDCALGRMDGTSPGFRSFLSGFSPDVVGVSSWSSMFSAIGPILRAVREVVPRAKTVLGGPHATACAQSVMGDASVDFLFRGEAEMSFPVFLRELGATSPDFSGVKGLAWRRAGGKAVMNEAGHAEDLDSIAPPDYDFMDLEGYLRQGYRLHCPEPRNAPILATRGCPYRCAFCTAPAMNGKIVRKHSIAYLTSLIRRLYEEKGIRWFNFVDDNFTYDTAWAGEFCRAIINMNLKGAGFGTPNGIRMQRGSPELWRLMKRAGWRSLVVAPESGSPRTLAAMRKDFDLGTLPQVVRDMQGAGLVVQAFFIIGYPGETREDLDDTIRVATQTGFDFFYLNNFQPLPGTPVFGELSARGEIAGDFLPASYSDGVRNYTPAELAKVNFPLLVLSTYLKWAIRRPWRFAAMLRFFNPRLLAKKLALNLLGVFRR